MSRQKILDLVRSLIEKEDSKQQFVAGKTYIRTSGASWNSDDVTALVGLALERWYTDGKFSYEFERLMATQMKQRHFTLCNSGSSANLLAVSALTSKKLKNPLKKGDEVVTVACGFPTTVNPIIQNGLVPVFVDVQLPSYNALPHAIEEAISDKTRAIIMAHTLGNPFKAKEIRDIADRNELILIGDTCDAAGAEYEGQPLPYWADISTFSFYPAHQISLAEGGGVSTDNPRLNQVIRSMRDWGRNCWCMTGKDNTCGKRFEWELGSLPRGFDHKYIYSEVGYNLKATDLQAVLGIGQAKRLSNFVQVRQENWSFYRKAFEEFREFFVLPEPTPRSKPSWFGFMLTVKESAPFTRRELITYLEENKIGTRMLFGGNLTRQPAYEGVDYRIIGTLAKSDRVADGGFWIGVAPIITRPMQGYVMEKVREFIKRY